MGRWTIIPGRPTPTARPACAGSVPLRQSDRCPAHPRTLMSSLRHRVIAGSRLGLRLGVARSTTARTSGRRSGRCGRLAHRRPGAGGLRPDSDLDGRAADPADLELPASPPGDRHEEHRELLELPDLPGAPVLLLGAEAEEEEHAATLGSGPHRRPARVAPRPPRSDSRPRLLWESVCRCDADRRAARSRNHACPCERHDDAHRPPARASRHGPPGRGPLRCAAGS